MTSIIGLSKEEVLEDDTIKTPEGIWTLEFDGSHSSSGSGVGIVLTTPSNELSTTPIGLNINAQTTLLNMKH
jgi:hypothetical protein